MTIAVTPIKIEMISAGITQPISIQFSVIRNQREGEGERMRARTHVPTKNKRESKRPKLLDFNVGELSLICQQELHPRRKITASLPFWSPAYYLLAILTSYLGLCQSDFRKSVHYLHENKYEH